MGAYKMTYGRKFWACLIVLVILTAMFFATLFVNKEALTPTVTLTWALLVVSVGFAYIGGNVWNKWVKSKFFHSEMTGGP